MEIRKTRAGNIMVDIYHKGAKKFTDLKEDDVNLPLTKLVVTAQGAWGAGTFRLTKKQLKFLKEELSATTLKDLLEHSKAFGTATLGKRLNEVEPVRCLRGETDTGKALELLLEGYPISEDGNIEPRYFTRILGDVIELPYSVENIKQKTLDTAARQIIIKHLGDEIRDVIVAEKERELEAAKKKAAELQKQIAKLTKETQQEEEATV